MAKATTKAPSAKEVLVEKYVADLKEKVGETRPDLALLDACVKACGPAIYKSDSATVAAADKEELARVLAELQCCRDDVIAYCADL